jgi:predicted nucleic acid-binding protein
MIVDANVIVQAFFPDETRPKAQALIRDHVSGKVQLVAPTLLTYEVTNAVLQGVRRKRVTDEDAKAILIAIDGLGIETEAVAWQQVLPMARQFGRSAYDAAYLALAEARGESLITGDEKLYNAVHNHLDWVQWIGDL